MISILFVDDDQRLLDGLARMLRPERHRWQMSFCLGGAAAIEQLAARPFDVLVCDMRMPEVDGLTVLNFAREHAPYTVRIVLSGQTELAAVTRAMPVVHQFLAKPCEPSVLRGVIERVTALRSLLNEPALRAAVGRLGLLPVLPRTYQEFTAALEDRDVPIPAIVRIVEQDVALSARCLQLANSAYFGRRARVESVSQAVSYLGLSMLRDLVLSSAVFSALRADIRLSHNDLEHLQQQAVRVANVARELHTDPATRQQAFIAGMLHDVGWIVAATCGIEESAAVAEDVLLGGGAPSTDEAVPDVAGPSVTHAEIGAYFLGLWGLPHSIVETAAYHHHPESVASDQFDVLGAVYTAIELLREHRVAAARHSSPDMAPLTTYLASIGAADRLPEFRRRAAAVLES